MLKRARIGFGFTTPSFFDCTQTLRPGRKTWEQVGRVSEEELQLALNSLPEHLQTERDVLLANYEEMFPWWHYSLKHGFNLLLYGVGSKHRVLESFASQLVDGVVVQIYAYMPAFRAKFMLLVLCQALELDHSVHASNNTLLHLILSSLMPSPAPAAASAATSAAPSAINAAAAEKPTTRAVVRGNLVAQLRKVYILIHGFDSQQYHGGELMSVLQSLAKSPKIGLVCGCDHVNAALLVSAAQRRLMNFLWVQTMTFDPYTRELNSSAQSSGITVEHMQGSLAVLRALPLNSQKIVFALVRMQLASGGATYADLYSYGRQHYLVPSDAALKNILVCGRSCALAPTSTHHVQAELRDHQMLRTRKAGDGTQVMMRGLCALARQLQMHCHPGKPDVILNVLCACLHADGCCSCFICHFHRTRCSAC